MDIPDNQAVLSIYVYHDRSLPVNEADTLSLPCFLLSLSHKPDFSKTHIKPIIPVKPVLMNGSGSFGIGKLFGIELELHWTFLFLLLIAGLIGGAATFLLIVLLFAMVVIHELAHSITAKRSGIEVKRIILFPLGGASIIDLEDVDSMTSFRIALAGPLTSLVLGFASGLIAVFAAGTAFGMFFQFLFILNMLLGVFNLLPAFPLDGGRVLKSYLERKSDPLSATKRAVNVSYVVVVLFILGSAGYFTWAYGISSFEWAFDMLWDFIIALFVISGARAELEGAYMHKYTSSLHVYDAISRNYVMVKPTTRMKQLYKVLLNSGTHVVLTHYNGNIGIVTRLSFNPLSKDSNRVLNKRVVQYATPLPVIDYNAPLSKAIDKMRFEETGIMAVSRGGRLAGVLVSQHVESIIALHLPRTMKGSRK